MIHLLHRPKTVLLAALLSWTAGSLAAQEPRLRVIEDTAIVQEMTLHDGTTLVGRIVRMEGDEVHFRTFGGVEVRLQRRDIARVRQLRGVRHGAEFWPEDPSSSRLFLAPTARVPGHGHGYVGVYELFFPSVAVGIGERVMISGGVSIFPGVSLDEQLFYVTPKVQVVSTNGFQAAVGLFWVKPATSEESAGMVFGGVTAGSETAAFSGGLAFPFASQSGFSEDPLVLLGGEFRVAKRIKIITENWIVPGKDSALLSFGIRIIGDRLTVELAWITSTEGLAIPLVSFSVTW